MIKQLRKEQGLSITALAEMAGISRPYLSQIESVKRLPSTEVIWSVAEVLHVDGLEIFKAYGYEQEVIGIEALRELEKLRKENKELSKISFQIEEENERLKNKLIALKIIMDS